MTAEAQGPDGAVVGYTLPTVVDDNPDATVECDPPPDTRFPLDTTLVTCTATDKGTLETSTATFHVTVQDTTPPTLAGVPADISAGEATGPLTPVTYTPPTATDLVDGNVPVDCNHPSGTGFPVGTTTVSCSATDAHGNTSPVSSFTVTVVDTTPPSLNLPSPGPVEATSAAGAIVDFSVTASDVADQGPTVSCDHSPGALFPLGTTTISCTATDASGNVSAPGSFTITVVDTTPPALNLPSPAPVEATGPAGAAVDFGVTANDLVDPSPTVSCDHSSGAVFALGQTTVSCTAKDAHNNASTGSFAVTVRDTIAPPDVEDLSAKAGNGSVALSWTKPSSWDIDHIAVFRSRPKEQGLGVEVYQGNAGRITLRRLRNGVRYRFVVVSVDRAGNTSDGAAILATPAVSMLYAPSDGATVGHPPVLRWRGVARATYYNVQLYRDSQKVLAVRHAGNLSKILSAWPTGTRLALKAKWRYHGRTYRLGKGVYRWFVWPAYGPPTAGRYGHLLGQSTFVVSR